MMNIEYGPLNSDGSEGVPELTPTPLRDPGFPLPGNVFPRRGNNCRVMAVGQ
jgi:hypothetical protein